MTSLDDLLAVKKFPTQDVTFCMDAGLEAARDAAMKDLNRAVSAEKNDPRLTAAPGRAERARVAEIEAEMKDKSVTIRFTGVSFGKYNEFLRRNPARKGKERVETYNPETFFMYVARETGKFVDSTGGEHDITKDQWDKIEAGLTDGQHDRLAQAIHNVNRVAGTKGVDFLSSNSPVTPDSGETSE